MERKLPVIEFSGTSFAIDIEKEQFREVGKPGNTIEFSDLKGDPEGGSILYYDKTWKKVYSGELTEGEIPHEVEVIVLPSFIELDPVGVARASGLPDDFFLT